MEVANNSFGSGIGADAADLRCGCSFVPDPTRYSVTDEAPSRKGSHLVNSRCALRSVHEVVSCFDQSKREIVKSIGFGGLLEFPPLKKLNRRFSIWLMGKVNESSRSLVLDNGKVITFNRDDVGKVFGIPCNGRRIIEKRGSRKDIRVGITGESSGNQFKDIRSIKYVQQLLERVHDSGMSKEDIDEFKVAFVVFVMSSLLATGSKHDYVFADYWSAVADPADIQAYDWASYVIDRLLDAVVKLKSDLVRKIKVTNITGCPLFLQVIYLDSIDLGLWNLDHNTFPRIKSFTPDRLRMMIEVDSRQDSGNSESDFGLSKLRQPCGICYSWAEARKGNQGHVQFEEDHGDLWESIVLMARRLKIPIESAGPVYLAILEHRRQQSALCHKQDTELVRAVTAILEPFMHGFNYQLDDECFRAKLDQYLLSQPHSGGTDFTSSVYPDMRSSRRKRKSRAETIAGQNDNSNGIIGHSPCNGDNSGGSPSSLFVWSEQHGPTADMIVSKAMSQFYIIARKSKATRCIDLNEGVEEFQCQSTRPCKEQNNSSVGIKSPWELGHVLVLDRENLRHRMSLLRELQESSNGSMPWFIHYTPKSIEVTAGSVKMQFLGLSEMEMDMFDVLIRRFKQLDDFMYKHYGPTRWRHFVESDFLAALIADNPGHFEAAFKDHLCGSQTRYDLKLCKIIFFPVILEHRWVCYAWKMDENSIVIFDPLLHGRLDGQTNRLHEHVVSLMKHGLDSTCRRFLPDWDHDWIGATTQIFRCTTPLDTRNRSGILAAYFCYSFDGIYVRPDFDQLTEDEMASLLLGEGVKLGANFGKLPDELV